MKEALKGPLEQLRDRLKYNATSQVCELTPRDCREMLVLLDWVEACEMDFAARVEGACNAAELRGQDTGLALGARR